ncbi:hypothetical protein [Salinivibrio sp. AR640]|nr:hypothetical protein [Salinivibrio sp. AR640]
MSRKEQLNAIEKNKKSSLLAVTQAVLKLGGNLGACSYSDTD